MNTRTVLPLLLLVALVAVALAPVGAIAQDSLNDTPYSETVREGSGQPSRNPEHGVIDWITSPIAGLMQLLYLLLSLFMGLMGILLDLAGKFLDVVLSVKNYAGVPLIIDGWKFIRDLTNFVFIFVLLAIAFSTIAGLESLQARQMLPKLLFAALLVNFSLGIGGAINGVATCVMNTAISSLSRPPQAGNPSRAALLSGRPASSASQSGGNAICGGGDNLGSTLVQGVANSASVGTYFAFGPAKLARLVYPNAETFESKKSVIVPGAEFDANFGAFLGAVSAALFTGFFIVALLVLVILFFIRTVILLMLLVLSPLPYAFGLIPAAQGYARQWWEQFVKYVIYGPVTILLTVLIVRILDRKGSQGTAAQQLFDDLGASTATFGEGAVSTNLAAAAFFTTFIVFYIIVAILIGNKLGIAGAGMATAFADRVTRGAAYYGGAVPALGAGRLGLKGAKGLAAGAGSAATYIPGVSAGLGLLRRGGRALTRPFSGKAYDDQLAEQQKELKRYDAPTLQHMFARGNAAAAAELSERDELTTAQFPQAMRVVPRGSKLREDLRKKFEAKAPATAILGSTAVGRAGAANADEQERLQKAIRRMKPEDFAKLGADELTAVIAVSKISGSKVVVPITQAQATSAINSTNVDLQDVVKDYIEKELRDPMSGAVKAGLKPALNSLENFARTKLRI